MALLVLGLISVVCVGVGAWRWHRNRQREAEERKRLRASAQIWGLAVVPGESTSELRDRIDEAMRQGRSVDPIETAAHALRAQRQRVTHQG